MTGLSIQRRDLSEGAGYMQVGGPGGYAKRSVADACTYGDVAPVEDDGMSAPVRFTIDSGR